MPNIRHKKNDQGGKFELYKDDQQIGYLSYTYSGEKHVTFDYAEVIPEVRGAGEAKKLVEAAVSWARENELKATPVCTYVRSVMKRDSSMHDVLK